MKLSDPTLLRSQCLIDGAWVGQGVDPIHNPATGALIASVPRLGGKEAVGAIEAAARAFQPWAKRTAKERAAILRRWFELIVANRDDIALIMTSEQGKPLAEARGEVDYAAAFVEFYAEEAKRIYGEIIPTFRADSRILVVKQPIGVVAAITPWNFPAAMITRKVGAGDRGRLYGGGQARARDAAHRARARRTRLARRHARRRAQPRSPATRRRSARRCANIPRCACVGFTGSTEVGKLLMAPGALGR